MAFLQRHRLANASPSCLIASRPQRRLWRIRSILMQRQMDRPENEAGIVYPSVNDGYVRSIAPAMPQILNQFRLHFTGAARFCVDTLFRNIQHWHGNGFCRVRFEPNRLRG